MTSITTVLAMASGVAASGAILAPDAIADPVTVHRVDLVSGALIAPDAQSVADQDDAEPGDAVQLIFYATGACTPQAGNAVCDPPNGAGQGVSGDSGDPLANATLTVTVDQGFFTPNCSTDQTSDPSGLTDNNYANCSFTTTPSAGAVVGNLVNSGTTRTVTTNSVGEFVVTLGIGRDPGFDDYGVVESSISVNGSPAVSPGDRASGASCLGLTILEPTLSGVETPPPTGGCPVEVEWTTEEAPLNGGTATLTSIPAIPTPPGGFVPTANNVAATDAPGGTPVPDVDRVDFVARLTDQFGNPTNGGDGGHAPSLTKTGPGSLYACTGSSAQSACTGGALAGTGTATQVDSSVLGSYSDAGSQHIYQADTTTGSINLRFPCRPGEGGCSAAHTATPGVNDGTQDDVLEWTPPTTTFRTYHAPANGIPATATYLAGSAPPESDGYALSFYDQLTNPAVTLSTSPDPAEAPAGDDVTAQVTVVDSMGSPIVGQTVAFTRSGTNASSCTAPATVSTDATGVGTYAMTCTTAGTTTVTATVTANPGSTQLAVKTATVTFTATLPGVPTGVSAQAGDGQATVSWTAPANNGGSPITGYDVQYSSNGGSTWTSASTAFHTSTATSHTVAGLTNGTSYVFRVAAINAVGTGSYSTPSVAVTPGGLPGTPTNVVATAGDAQASVSWLAPAANGSPPISGYDVQYSSNGGASWTPASSTFHTSTATTHTVTGLTNGTSYVFRVAALNASGTGTYSEPSSPVTPTSPGGTGRPGTTPAAPTGVSATAGNGQATVTWSAPASSGGSPITGYVVQDSTDNGTSWNATAEVRGSAAGRRDGPSTSKVVTGLVNNVSYVFRVAATNASGTGAYSAPSEPVTPHSMASHLAISGPHTLGYGQSAAVSAKLTTDGSGVAGATLTLQRRTTTHGGWTTVATHVSSGTGDATAVVYPGRNVWYRWRFAGDATHASAISAAQRITVHQVVRATVLSRTVSAGGSVQIFGTVSPNESGRVVTLQVRKAGRWVTTHRSGVIRRQTLPDGQRTLGYVIAVPTHGRGHFTYRVHRGATSRNAAGNSTTVTLRVT